MLRGLISVLIHQNNSAVLVLLIYQVSKELYSFIHFSIYPIICKSDKLFLYMTFLKNYCFLLGCVYLIVYILFVGLNMAKRDNAAENFLTANRGKTVPGKDGNEIIFNFLLHLKKNSVYGRGSIIAALSL